MKIALEDLLSRGAFDDLAAWLRRQWNVPLLACAPDGAVVYPNREESVEEPVREARELAISEAVRWGEATIRTAPGGCLAWGVPLMVNDRLLGGLVVEVDEERVFDGELDAPRIGRALREAVEQRNLTNTALLAAHREKHERERRRAEAIHEMKLQSHQSLRRTYLQEEPELIAAIRQGDMPAARRILDRLLVVMHQRADGNLELAKSFFMELVIAMARAAVEVGGSAEELLGANYANIVELAGMTQYEQVAPWLTGMLENLMQTIHTHARTSNYALISTALSYMEEHLAENVTRDEVAEVCHMSPTHFSRTFKEHVGRTFVDVLNRMRVDQAAEMLVRTDRELAMVALDCGFSNQSYFTRVFGKYKGQPPGEFRREKRGG
jgi:AraC-like DNA-binding protein